ncbi:hypothetical protein A4X13_0g7147 [Tilletia indica]|uniref:Uncharacterized protein n=1 Tax=Tilletia indica TaxID=43049 RepID=A0A8T8SK87_9BASI|nr:hypothetical protein A4X13_0g7147 [Tilletia indica]
MATPSSPSPTSASQPLPSARGNPEEFPSLTSATISPTSSAPSSPFLSASSAAGPISSPSCVINTALQQEQKKSITRSTSDISTSTHGLGGAVLALKRGTWPYPTYYASYPVAIVPNTLWTSSSAAGLVSSSLAATDCSSATTQE